VARVIASLKTRKSRRRESHRDLYIETTYSCLLIQ